VGDDFTTQNLGANIFFLQSLVSLQKKEMGDKERRVVFVTVGTTCFDALVKVVDSEEVKRALMQKGYTHLVIQMGRGTYMPSVVTFLSILQPIFFV
jgi:beta-1,4-N-acetylglucosaminyltransferase